MIKIVAWMASLPKMTSRDESAVPTSADINYLLNKTTNPKVSSESLIKSSEEPVHIVKFLVSHCKAYLS